MKQSLAYIHNELKEIYSSNEIQGFIQLIFNHIRAYSYTDIVLKKEQTMLDADEVLQIKDIVNKLKDNIPIQYILGVAEFCGLNFKVDSSVLIPRQETEELVDWICSDNETASKLKVLDVCTGSGCIAISLKKMLNDAEVFAIDISNDAIHTASENAILNSQKIHFSKLDALSSNYEMDGLDFDILVSNPPYVLNSEKKLMPSNVLEHEPHLALFVEDNNPLIFYKAIAHNALNLLRKKNGFLYFEINEALGIELVTLLKTMGYEDVQFRKDLNNKDRMIRARAKN